MTQLSLVALLSLSLFSPSLSFLLQISPGLSAMVTSAPLPELETPLCTWLIFSSNLSAVFSFLMAPKETPELHVGSGGGVRVAGFGGEGAVRQAGPSCGRFDLACEVKAAIETRGWASYLNLPHFKSWARACPTPSPPSSLPPSRRGKGIGGREREREGGRLTLR